MPIYWKIFEKYRGNKNTYIETGSLHGDSIQSAIDDGYAEIHAIEADQSCCEHCKNRFKDNSGVTMHLGDSAKTLAEVLKQVKQPATIFLDAHFGVIPNAEYTPLMSELNAIKQFGNPDSCIMVDDIRLLKDNENQIPWTKDEVIAKLHEINPNYKIAFERGFIENDILVAYIEEKVEEPEEIEDSKPIQKPKTNRRKVNG